MTALALVVLAGAGAVGSLLRYLAGVALPARRGLPWGVLLVNILGSFIAGLGVAAIADPLLRLALVTGFCGGLTTFSTHAVDTVRLASGELGGAGRDTATDARRALSIRLALAAANVVVTLALTLAAVSVGIAVAGGAPAR